MTLLDNNGNVISTNKTGPNGATNGYYTFTNLIPGSYVVSLTVPSGYTFTPADSGADGTDTAESGVSGVVVDLYKDTNGDGVFTPGGDQFVSATVSAGGGFYNFTALIPGGYVVVIPAINFYAGSTRSQICCRAWSTP